MTHSESTTHIIIIPKGKKKVLWSLNNKNTIVTLWPPLPCKTKSSNHRFSLIWEIFTQETVYFRHWRRCWKVYKVFFLKKECILTTIISGSNIQQKAMISQGINYKRCTYTLWGVRSWNNAILTHESMYKFYHSFISKAHDQSHALKDPSKGKKQRVYAFPLNDVVLTGF